MAERPKRRRLNPDISTDSDHQQQQPKHFNNNPLQALIPSEKNKWHGFCEIESEPALFNVMLKDFGVKGVKVQEVVSLDEEMMAFIHKPIYGLIFLFRWKEDDPDKQEQSCPEGLWFANQTVSYACASVALLNIINNVAGIDLGEQLHQFKEFTMSFTPALRGDAIGNFEFVKQIHNSFARKMDVLNTDLQLKNEASQKRPRTNKKGSANDESEAGFHFIAFVPVEGRVWKFDGLERQPQSLGNYDGEEWVDVARPDILSRMAEYEEDRIEFSVLSLVKDPMIDLVSQLAANVKSLSAIDELLAAAGISESDSETPEGTILGADKSFELTPEVLGTANVSETDMSKYRSASSDKLLRYRREIADNQKSIRGSIKEEKQARDRDEDYAASRRHDYGPAIHTWVRKLGNKKVAETLAGELESG